MWKCPTCGEQIEDRFDSCWKCTKVEPVLEPADDHGPKRQRVGFWCAWRRGWFVLLMMLVYGVVAALVRLFFEHTRGISAVVGVGVAIFILPLSAYWVFVLFFGEEAWPPQRTTREISREHEAEALLSEATQLEARGRAKEALAKYQMVMERFSGT